MSTNKTKFECYQKPSPPHKKNPYLGGTIGEFQ